MVNTLQYRPAGNLALCGGTLCVVTCHNYGRFLKQCLDSLLRQTVPFARVVVVDDSSTDETASVVAAYENRSVQYHRVECGNVALARNAGVFFEYRHEFLLFMDADDYMEPDFHQRLLKVLKDSPQKVGIAYGNLLRFGEDGEDGPLKVVRKFTLPELRRRNLAGSPSLMRREVFDQIGGWEPLVGVLTDWTFWLKATNLGWEMVFVPDAKLHYRRHPAQVSFGRNGDCNKVLAAWQFGFVTTIVTLFSGREWALPLYKDFLDSLEWNKKSLFVLALDNSNKQAFHEALHRMLYSTGIAFGVVRCPEQPIEGTAPQEFADDRTLRSQNGYLLNVHLARLYAKSRLYLPAGSGLVWTVEDDTVPPPDALKQLALGLHQNPNAGMVGGIEFSRQHGGLFAFKEGVRLDDLPNEGYLQIDRTGAFCALFHRAAFDGLAFRPTDQHHLGNLAFDWVMCNDLTRTGQKVYLACGVRCKHYNKDGSYV